MSDMDKLFIVETEPEPLPELIGAVVLIVTPIIVHPGQGVGACLIPRVQQVERMSRLMHESVQIVPDCPCLILVLRLPGRQVVKPCMLAEDCKALSLRRLARTTELS